MILNLLSQNKKEDFPIAGINIPAKVVSGDFYNFSDLGEGKYGFGVADVSGKGIKSSLLMSKASSLYRCLSKTIFSPAELLNILKAFYSYNPVLNSNVDLYRDQIL